MKLRKGILILCSLMLVLSLAACGSSGNSADTQKKSKSQNGDAIQSDTAVVYFSATGTTRGVAKTLAGCLGIKSSAMEPKKAYTDKDLDYNDDSCRANQEQKDPEARPEIGSDLSGVENCDTIYLGYPIWWGTAPRIIETFLDTYDLSGKTVYLFCTSGSSGIEQSQQDLQKLYPDVNFAAAKRFEGGASKDEVNAWLQELQ